MAPVPGWPQRSINKTSLTNFGLNRLLDYAHLLVTSKWNDQINCNNVPLQWLIEPCVRVRMALVSFLNCSCYLPNLCHDDKAASGYFFMPLT